MNPRKATKSRKTNETEIRVSLDLDGSGEYKIGTGIPFFDHMLQTLARYSGLGIAVEARGDLRHHIVEDVAICLGKALASFAPPTRAYIVGRHHGCPSWWNATWATSPASRTPSMAARS